MGLGQMRTAVTLIRTVTEKDNEGFARKTDKTVAVFRAYREGRHGQPAKPFLKPAKTASKSACIDAMVRILEEEIKKV